MKRQLSFPRTTTINNNDNNNNNNNKMSPAAEVISTLRVTYSASKHYNHYNCLLLLIEEVIPE